MFHLCFNATGATQSIVSKVDPTKVWQIWNLGSFLGWNKDSEVAAFAFGDSAGCWPNDKYKRWAMVNIYCGALHLAVEESDGAKHMPA